MQVTLKGLLAILQDIFNQSTLISGRFFALRTSSDINITNFGQLIQDNLGGIIEGNKYPCALLLPPFKVKKNDQKGWGKYKIQIYFLVLDKRNTNVDIKTVDPATNLSWQVFTDDWNDTNIIADQFFIQLYQYLIAGSLIGSVHEDKDTRQYHYLTEVGNDKLNGCHISFDISMWEGDNCNALTDYVNPIFVNVTNFSPNTLNKQ
jgi:hypothetical protein